MKLLVKKSIIVIIITMIYFIKIYYVSANNLNVPIIEDFSKSTIENNALKVVIKSNNNGNDYSFELYNVTTNKKNILAGSSTTYTYQNLTKDKTYEVKIRACSNNVNTYVCSNWSNSKKEKAGTIPDKKQDSNENTNKLKSVKNVTLSKTSYVYDGKVKSPSVKVIDDDNKTLIKDTDYIVKYDNSPNIGVHNVTVIGKGNYSFNKKLTYKIKLQTPDIYRVMSTSERIDFNYYVVKDQVIKDAGFQIAYKKKSDSKWVKFYIIRPNATIPKGYNKKKLKALTKYSFKVRAYNIINNKKVYSSWSKTINHKTLAKKTKYTLERLDSQIKNNSFKYTGKNIKPNVIVKDYSTGKTLKKGTHYTLKYPSSTKKGTYYITVNGKGKYAKNYPQYIRYKIVK